jgi:tetratricopeptide (TPR) repeat protein
MNCRLVSILLCLTIAVLELGGCALLPKERTVVGKPPKARLEKVLLERAVEYERKGKPHRALQAYEAALAVLMDRKQGLEDTLRTEAEKHYQRGLEFNAQGKYSKARHEFLVALRLWPDYPEVVELLKPFTPLPAGRYIVHKVEEGEFLTAIAEKYYEDQSKFELIARYNELEDATKVYTGMNLKIPETERVSFSELAQKQYGEISRTDEVTVQDPQGGKTDGGDEYVSYLSAESPSISAEQYDPVEIYQEQGVSLLEEGQYLAALHEFRKVLNTDPTREKVREYMAWAHYRQGEVLFNQADYLGARDHFQEALSYDEEWVVCKEYIKRAEDAYKEVHYLKGIEHFEEERLKEAIEEWRLVSTIDPDYKQVKSNLLRARKLWEKIQELKEAP